MDPEARASASDAKKEAAIANQKIDDHERHCGERWKEARDEMRRLHMRISDSHNRIVRWIIGGQGGAIIAVIAYVFYELRGTAP